MSQRRCCGGGTVRERSNVIDLMAALKKNLGQPQPSEEKPQRTKPTKQPERRQAGLKPPIEGGKKNEAEKPAAQPTPRTRRKAS